MYYTKPCCLTDVAQVFGSIGVQQTRNRKTIFALFLEGAQEKTVWSALTIHEEYIESKSSMCDRLWKLTNSMSQLSLAHGF